MSRLQFKRVRLGQGGYGSVFPGKLDGCSVAVKRVQLTKLTNDEESAMGKLNHENVVKLLHSESDNDFK